MARYHIEISDQPLKALLQQLAERGEKPRAAMEEIGFYVIGATRRNFDTQTAPDGKRWTPLKRATIRNKKKRKDRILEESLLLRDSVRHQADDNSVTVGTNVIYGRIHQLGGVIDRMPYSIRLRLRTNKDGTLMRQRPDKNFVGPQSRGYNQRLGRLAVFASRRAKSFREIKASVGAYRIVMPARPFLGLSAQDRGEVAQILRDFLLGR